jgi:hypothetical protein
MPETHQEDLNPDRIAEQNVDAIPQERFDAFAPNESPTATWSHAHEVAAQTGTRIGHAIFQATGGRGAHGAESRAQLDEERVAVGLPPKFTH